VRVETFTGDVSGEVKQGMAECLLCSIRHTRSLLPVQAFLGSSIFRSALFKSDRYVHFVIRVDGRIAGFSTRLRCNKNLIGIMGGYNREIAGGGPVYDLMIVSTLQYCLDEGFGRLVYGVVDNHTKAKMMDSFREQHFYCYSQNPAVRFLMEKTYRFTSAYELSRLKQSLPQKAQN
jgi:hypothetical protein